MQHHHSLTLHFIDILTKTQISNHTRIGTKCEIIYILNSYNMTCLCLVKSKRKIIHVNMHRNPELMLLIKFYCDQHCLSARKAFCKMVADIIPLNCNCQHTKLVRKLTQQSPNNQNVLVSWHPTDFYSIVVNRDVNCPAFVKFSETRQKYLFKRTNDLL